MNPRYVPGGEQFTKAQARLVVERAGLDITKPLDQQLDGDGEPVGLEQQVAALSTRVEQLTERLATPAEPPKSQEETFTEQYAAALGNSRSKWFRSGGEPADAA